MVLSLPPPTPLLIFIPDTLDLKCNSQGPLTHSTAKGKKPPCKSIFFPNFSILYPKNKALGLGFIFCRVYMALSTERDPNCRWPELPEACARARVPMMGDISTCMMLLGVLVMWHWERNRSSHQPLSPVTHEMEKSPKSLTPPHASLLPHFYLLPNIYAQKNQIALFQPWECSKPVTCKEAQKVFSSFWGERGDKWYWSNALVSRAAASSWCQAAGKAHGAWGFVWVDKPCMFMEY